MADELSNLPKTRLYKDIAPSQWPIIYSTNYNIGFLYLEKLHPFDSSKWGSIINFLRRIFSINFIFLYTLFISLEAKMITNDTIIEPNEATKDELLVVHTRRYLSSLKWSIQVAAVLEVPLVALLPNFIVQWRVLKPLRYQTGGTVLVNIFKQKKKTNKFFYYLFQAGKLALERGWAINIGGGFHHCSSDRGGGFCAYADLTLLIKNLFNHYPDRVKKVLIVDLDAHQVKR
jgi:histone deacetylase 11